VVSTSVWCPQASPKEWVQQSDNTRTRRKLSVVRQFWLRFADIAYASLG
jgi:hypothetical protein